MSSRSLVAFHDLGVKVMGSLLETWVWLKATSPPDARWRLRSSQSPWVVCPAVVRSSQ